MELLTEKIISSAGMPLSPGDCLRRVMESLSSGILCQGPGLMDPCEKEPLDALAGLSKQQREDITVTAQQFLRYIAFRQIHKALGMEPLPVQKYQGNRPWKFNPSRKRRRSGTETSEGENDYFLNLNHLFTKKSHVFKVTARRWSRRRAKPMSPRQPAARRWKPKQNKIISEIFTASFHLNYLKTLRTQARIYSYSA